MQISCIEKYLNKYGESICIEGLKLEPCQFVLVIPAYREGAEFLENLRDFSRRNKSQALIIIVINAPDNASADVLAENQNLLNCLLSMGPIISKTVELYYLIELGHLRVLILGPLIINKRYGVGQARKFGCDLALKFINKGIIKTPIIYMTDADAELCDSYFVIAEKEYIKNNQTAAFIYPFTHRPPQEVRQRQAIELYEQRLNAYVAGLSYAQSPYAFHTIGSTIAVSAEAYAQVRGVPKLSAGEDFYLLNKLRKVGLINSLDGPAIKLSARLSNRVPFGTGPSISYILQYKDPLSAPIFYNPQIFIYLHYFLRWQIEAINAGQCEIIDGYLPDNNIIDFAWLKPAIKAIKSPAELKQNLLMRKTIADRIRAFHHWFDAFKTLKFIHYLRDHYLPMCTSDEFNNVLATKSWQMSL